MNMTLKALMVLTGSVICLPLQADIMLTFGTYTSDKPTTMVKKFRPLLNALEQELGALTTEKVKIKLHIARSYQTGIDNIINGKVDIARLGPASYIKARERSAGIHLLAMESKKGKKRFNGVICTKADSKFKKIEDLRGHRFAFGNQKSTIGRYLSQSYLMKHGLYAKSFSEFSYLDRHDKVGYAVSKGDYDAGALKEGTFKKLIKKGEPLKALAVFENVTKPWVARAGLSDSLRKKLTTALLNIKDKKALSALKKDGFLNGKDSDYNFVRQSIKDNHRFFQGN